MKKWLKLNIKRAKSMYTSLSIIFNQTFEIFNETIKSQYLYLYQQETSKSVRSILNKLTSENIDELIKRFMALPLNTIERLENAVDLVFERVIFFNVIRKKYDYTFDLDKTD